MAEEPGPSTTRYRKLTEAQITSISGAVSGFTATVAKQPVQRLNFRDVHAITIGFGVGQRVRLCAVLTHRMRQRGVAAASRALPLQKQHRGVLHYLQVKMFLT